MKIRISYQLISALCAIVFVIPAAEGATQCRHTTGERESAPLDEDSRLLIDALTGEIREKNKRINILYAAARRSDQRSGIQYFLSQRALLTVAGELMERGRFKKSRELLRTVELESPVAVEAALLLADSWRMQDDPSRARDWYLRAGQQFPHELLAMQGMLSAARAMESEAPRAAAALYDRVYEQAMDSAQKLADIPDDEASSGLDWLLSGNTRLPGALHSQLSHRVLTRGESSIMALETRQENSSVSLGCIIKRAGELQNTRGNIAAKMVLLNQSIEQLTDRVTLLDAEISTLEADVTPGQMDPTQVKLRKALVRRKNQRKHLLGQRLFLRQNRERLPKMLDRLQTRAQDLYDEYHQENLSTARSIRQLVTGAIETLKNDFLNVAAASRDDEARLMETLADKQ